MKFNKAKWYFGGGLILWGVMQQNAFASSFLSRSMSFSSDLWTIGLLLLVLMIVGVLGLFVWKNIKNIKKIDKTNSVIPIKKNEEASSVSILDQPMTRRSFISVLGLGWVTFAAASLGAFAGFVRFLFPQVTFEPNPVFEAGLPSEFTIGVHSQFKLNKKVFLVRDHSGFYALSSICTHLGCIPNWLPSEQIFKCPCHGSGYYISGINFEGPAPRPLPRYEITLASNGKIRVNKSHQYLYELHQWGLPGSFLDYAG